jgi:Flp pilus assembly protein TadD
MRRRLSGALVALAALSMGAQAAWTPQVPRGAIWSQARVLADGTEEASGSAVLLEGFPGPVTFLHMVAGASAVRLATPSGIVESRRALAVLPGYDLVLLEVPEEALEGAPRWPAPAPATVEPKDTLWVYSPNTQEAIRITSDGFVEVPRGLTILHLSASPRGPAPVVDRKGRLQGLGGQMAVAEGLQAYAVPAKALQRLAEAVGNPRRLEELAGLEPDWLLVKTPPGQVLAGGLLVRNGKMEAGLTYLDLAISRAPELAEAHFEMGFALDRQHRRADARVEFQKANELRPCYTRARIHEGAALFMLRRYAEAESLYLAALECDSTRARIYVNLGGLANMRGRKDLAETYTRKALEMDPDLDVARFNLAVILRNAGHLEEARKQLEALRANGSALAPKLEKLLERK